MIATARTLTATEGLTDAVRVCIPLDHRAEQIAKLFLEHELAAAKAKGPLLVLVVGVVTAVDPRYLAELRLNDPEAAALVDRFAAMTQGVAPPAPAVDGVIDLAAWKRRKR